MATKTGELRETLIAAIDDLRAKKITPEQAKAIALLASQINASLNVEINALRELRALGIKKAISVGGFALGEIADDADVPLRLAR